MAGIKSDENPEKCLKAYLSKTIMKEITKDMLVSHNVYNEIKCWFEKMSELNKILL